MRVLFLTPQLPYPPRQGSALRNYYLLRGLAAAGITVDLLTFASPMQIAASQQNPLTDLCSRLELVPLPPARSLPTRLRTLLAGKPDMAARLPSPAYAARLQTMSAAVDYLQVEGVEMASYALNLRQPFYFDAHNAEFVIQQRAASTDAGSLRRLPKAAYSWVQARRLQGYERVLLRRARRVLAVSALDAAALASLEPQQAAKIAVIANGVDTVEYAPVALPTLPPGWATASLVFTGVLDYRPNVDALDWFCRRVWPTIYAAMPIARCYIVGARANAAVQALAAIPGVVLVGEVAEVQPYIAAASLFVVPMRIGGGSRLKLLQALAMGKCILSTTLGAEGIAVSPGLDVAVADSAADFAATALRLLNDAGERSRYATAARQLALQYDWQQIVPRLSALYAADSDQDKAWRSLQN